ncbi:phosphoinositide-3-kinase-interacting protein 1-like [Ruditapes philippinarum]|uniref:phosphoinositide-3-kinase-interacting protein 1-like n=1 Tax=Ruditapes philippinarum TaxID=129788 RepID=UPI00295A86F7|nr:phosphoinositide-3-kinase-interacting protein 1-like [Ruditapes philippinarum]
MSRNICSLCTVISAILSTVIIPSKGVVLDCYTTTVSKYDGHQQTSKDEQPCLRWDQFETYSASDFPDATKSDAANFCRSPDGHNESWCFTTDQGDRRPCGITKCGDDGLSNCGQLSIAKPTILGRYVEFSFTPDTYDPNAILEWQRSMNGKDRWKTLPLNDKFNQFEKNMIYHMILSDTEKNQDERFYRVHYYNETSHCWMNAGKLTLEGMVY